MSSVFTSDQDVANFAADMGFVVRRGEYYGIGMDDFDADELLDSESLMALLMSRWTFDNFIEVCLEGVDREYIVTPRAINLAMLEQEQKLRILMLADTKGG